MHTRHCSAPYLKLHIPLPVHAGGRRDGAVVAALTDHLRQRCGTLSATPCTLQVIHTLLDTLQLGTSTSSGSNAWVHVYAGGMRQGWRAPAQPLGCISEQGAGLWGAHVEDILQASLAAAGGCRGNGCGRTGQTPQGKRVTSGRGCRCRRASRYTSSSSSPCPRPHSTSPSYSSVRSTASTSSSASSTVDIRCARRAPQQPSLRKTSTLHLNCDAHISA